jgi:hypothetical protein
VSARSYSDEELATAVAVSRSWRGVLRHLGLVATSSAAIRSVRHHADRLDLDHGHFTGQRRWTVDELDAAIGASRSWSQVAAVLGLSGGSSAALLKGHAARLGIDTSHMSRPAGLPPGSAPMDARLSQLPRAGSLLAAAWFTMCGYDVSWPLEPCRYDLLAALRQDILRVQVETTRVKDAGGWVVSLSNTRGERVTYDPDEIDYFFVVDGDLEYYLLPVGSVGGLHSASLSAYDQFRLSQDPTTTT